MNQNKDSTTLNKDLNVNKDQTGQAYDKNRNLNKDQQQASGAKQNQFQDDKLNQNIGTDVNRDVKSNLLGNQDIQNKDFDINKDRNVNKDFDINKDKDVNKNWDKDQKQASNLGNQGYNVNDPNRKQI